MPPDIVYRLKSGGFNDQLRYSLRSLSNIPHGRVWIAGYKPAFVRNVEHIENPQRGNKWESSNSNLRAALNEPGVSEDFLLFDDDFYVARPVESMPVYHRGTVDAMVEEYSRHLTNDSRYMQRVIEARDTLMAWGYEKPLCYEVHYPFPVNKTTMAGVLNRLRETRLKFSGPQYRTFYGNIAEVSGTQVEDCKIYQNSQVAVFAPNGTADLELIGESANLLVLSTPFVSTNRASFVADAGRWLRKQFPEPCDYERE